MAFFQANLPCLLLWNCVQEETNQTHTYQAVPLLSGALVTMISGEWSPLGSIENGASRLVASQFKANPMAKIKRRIGRGHKPETNQVVAMATYDLACWEHGEKSAGVALNWASCYCPFGAASVGHVFNAIPQCKQPSHEFSVRFITTYSANVFLLPNSCIYSLHESKTTSSEHKKKQLFFPLHFGCSTPEYA